MHTRPTALLTALGRTWCSMHPSPLLEVGQAIAGCNIGRLRKLGGTRLRAQTRAGIEKVLERMRATAPVAQ